jgi:hypothetical protein
MSQSSSTPASTKGIRNLIGAVMPHRIRRAWNGRERRQFSYAAKFLAQKYLPLGGETVPLSPRAQEVFDQMERNGYARIEDPIFKKMADYVEETYCARITPDKYLDAAAPELPAPLFFSATDWPKGREYGNYNFRLSFKDRNLHEYLFNRDIQSALYKYAGRQLYYRESPMLEELSYNGSDIVKDVIAFACDFHTDFYKQVNLMLLLTDINDETTSTEYARASNNRNVLLEGNNLVVPRTTELIQARSYPIDRLSGKRGDVLMMDTTGFHRASFRVGSTRRMLIALLNPGYPFIGYKEDVAGLEFAPETPEFVRKTIRK